MQFYTREFEEEFLHTHFVHIHTNVHSQITCSQP